MGVKVGPFIPLPIGRLIFTKGLDHQNLDKQMYAINFIQSNCPVWDITWMSGQVHALGQVDGSNWASDWCAPGQVAPPTDHLIKCHPRFGAPASFPSIA